MSKNNDFLGSKKISSLLFQMSLPATIGMLVATLYNVVDSIFIGQGVGYLGLAGVAIVFPFMMFVMSLAQGLGIGASSIISRKFGEKKTDEANRAFGNFITLILLVSIFLIIVSFVFGDQILLLLGSSSTIFPYAKDYFSIITIGFIFQMFTMASNNIIRSQGDAKVAMIVMLIGGLVNLVLDPIFIFVLDMGISGAAWATVISQFLTFIFALAYFISNKSILSLYLHNLILDIKIVKEIFLIGVSSFARQSSTSIVGILMNNSLRFYGGDIAIAAYGIIFKLIMLLVMPSMGVLQGSLPILGYNYGAKKFQRVKETLSLSIKSSTIIILFFYITIIAYPNLFISLFTSESDLIEFTIVPFRIFVLMFPLVAYQFIIGGYFQAIGKVKPALIVSLLRQVILLIPMLLILPLYFGLIGIWIAYPIADFIGFVITFLIMKKEYKFFEI